MIIVYNDVRNPSLVFMSTNSLITPTTDTFIYSNQMVLHNICGYILVCAIIFSAYFVSVLEKKTKKKHLTTTHLLLVGSLQRCQMSTFQ